MNRSRYVSYAIGFTFAMTLVAACLFFSQPARADIDVRIDIGGAPPPPHFIFHSRPHERYYPGERMYVVDDPGIGDYDVFRYGTYYWVFYDGYWYRSYSWRGPFIVMRPRYVPTVFYRLPRTRWKHYANGPARYSDGGRSGRRVEPVAAPRYSDDRRTGTRMDPNDSPRRMQPRQGDPARMPQGRDRPAMQPRQSNPPAQMPQRSDRPAFQPRQGGDRPAMQPQQSGPPTHMQQGGAQGHEKQGNTPPGQAKKGDKKNDKGGDHGKN